MKKGLKKVTVVLLIAILMVASIPTSVFAESAVDMPDLSWKMSDPNDVKKASDYSVSSGVLANLTIPLTVETNIWDGGTSSQRFTGYYSLLSEEWTSWKRQHSNDVDLRRFQMTFEKSNNTEVMTANIISQLNGNNIGINDRMYVFVNGTLAFWGGTSATGSIAGVAGILAGSDRTLYPETDGWFITQNVNVAPMLVNGTNVVDIFTEENATGGGMDRLAIKYLSYKQNVDVTFINQDISKLVTVEKGTKVATEAVEAREGFIFGGWYNGEQLYNFETPVTEPITLRAKWLPVNMYFSVDNEIEVYHNGNLLTPVFTPTGGSYEWQLIKYYYADLQPGDVIAVKGTDEGVVAGFIGEIRDAGTTYPTQTESFWRQSEILQTGWNQRIFNTDANWGTVTEYDYASWNSQGLIGAPAGFNAEWIWSNNHDFNSSENHVVYFRYVVGGTNKVTFDSNGGNAISNITIPTGTTLSGNAYTVPVPVKEGYTFTKWVIKDTTTEFNGAYAVLTDIEVVAQYTENTPVSSEPATDAPVTTAPATEPPASSEPATDAPSTTAPAKTEAATEIITTEAVAAGDSNVINFDAVLEATEATSEDAVEVEFEIDLEETPLADALPQTGQLPVELFYGVGGLITAAGVFLKKRK